MRMNNGAMHIDDMQRNQTTLIAIAHMKMNAERADTFPLCAIHFESSVGVGMHALRTAVIHILWMCKMEYIYLYGIMSAGVLWSHCISRMATRDACVL